MVEWHRSAWMYPVRESTHSVDGLSAGSGSGSDGLVRQGDVGDRYLPEGSLQRLGKPGDDPGTGDLRALVTEQPELTAFADQHRPYGVGAVGFGVGVNIRNPSENGSVGSAGGLPDEVTGPHV